MGVVDAGDGGALFLDGVHEIRPEEREIMAVGLLELRVFVDLLFTISVRAGALN